MNDKVPQSNKQRSVRNSTVPFPVYAVEGTLEIRTVWQVVAWLHKRHQMVVN